MGILKFSKKGDKGETSLLSGERVSKASLRPETYGTLDEASCALGLAKAFTENDKVRQMIADVQEDLRVLGGELACEKGEKPCQIDADRTLRLEQLIEELQADVDLPRHFIQPGANAVSAAMDLGRSIIRRAERRAVALREAGLLEHEEVHAYLNRLSDYLYTLARYVEKKG